MISKEVRSGRIGGVSFTRDDKMHAGAMFVLWNQWRSSAASLFSSNLAGFLLEDERIGRIVCLDRIASGGLSDNILTPTEKNRMKSEADVQFAEDYAKAVMELTHKDEHVIVAGSSGGTLAVLATAQGLHGKKHNVSQLVLVEPTGLRTHGFKNMPWTGILHGLARHIIAYRHRVRRGWWTPMDREQYRAKGHMLERRGSFFL